MMAVLGVLLFAIGGGIIGYMLGRLHGQRHARELFEQAIREIRDKK